MKALIAALLMSVSVTACGSNATIPSASAIEQIHSSAHIICSALKSEVDRVAWKVPSDTRGYEASVERAYVPMTIAVRCKDESFHQFKFDAQYQKYETDYND